LPKNVPTGRKTIDLSQQKSKAAISPLRIVHAATGGYAEVQRGSEENTGSDYCREIPISNNVGGVKLFSSTLRHALGEERHFALVEGLRFPTKGSLAIAAVRNSARPGHLFDHNHDHNYSFELPQFQGSGMPTHYVGDLLHTLAQCIGQN
jgi:hypothetical protein